MSSISRNPSVGSDLSEVLRLKHLPCLDAIRAVAALSVVLHHGRYYVGHTLPADGVTIFFVLSGFLITTLLLKEWDNSSDISIRGFYIRRVLRIMPAYYVFVLFSWTFDALKGQTWPTGLTLSGGLYLVNYLNAFNGHETGGSITHAWSLAVEEQFYLLWPLLFVFLMKRGETTLRKCLAVLLVTGAVWRAILLLAGAPEFYLYNAFDTRYDNLAVGCLLATWVRDARFTRASRVLTSFWWAPMVTLGLMVAVVRGLSSDQRFLFGMPVYCLLVAVLLVQLLQLHAHKAWRWLDVRPIRFLGALSYSTYLYHVRFLGVGTRLWFLPPVLQLLMSILTILAVAALSYFLIERPFLRLKDRAYRKPVTLPVSRPALVLTAEP